MAKKSASEEGLILYRKAFPLKANLTFTGYISALKKINFSPYVLLFDKISAKRSCQLEIIWIPRMEPVDPFSAIVLLNKCQMNYSRRRREILFEAYPDSEWLLHGMAVSLLLIALGLYIAIELGFSIAAIFLLATPVVLALNMYYRDIRRYEKIGRQASMKTKEK